MAYYTSEICGYVNGSWVDTGCTTDYAQSEVKYVVDAWSNDKFESGDLIEDKTGYSARLITKEEYEHNCKVEQYTTPSGTYDTYHPRYDWMYNSNYCYWTMSTYNDSSREVWDIAGSGGQSASPVGSSGNNFNVIRPVITLKKTAIN